MIKVENPSGGDTCRENAPYLGADGASLVRRSASDVSVSAINRLRNKLGITLNLKHPEARAVFADLVKKSDVLVENYSRGTLDRLGVGYRWLREVNPKLVYCSITGYGSNDDASPAKAMDTIIQAQSGMMYTSGEPDDPPVRIGIPVADLCAPMFGVIGVLAAIHQAQRTGLGQHIDVSMLGALTTMVSVEPFDLWSAAVYRRGQVKRFRAWPRSASIRLGTGTLPSVRRRKRCPAASSRRPAVRNWRMTRDLPRATHA